MRIQTLVLGSSILLGGLLASLGAQTLAARFDIPFEFSVQGKTLPAGQYTLRPGTNGNGSFTLESAADRSTVMLTTFDTGSTSASASATIAFNRYGSQRFLAVISIGGGALRQVTSSAAERNAAKLAAPGEVETVKVSGRFPGNTGTTRQR